MANYSSSFANLIATTVFYAPVIPKGIIVCLGGILLIYAVEKWNLLRNRKRPIKFSANLPFFFMNILPYLSVVWAISSILFIKEVH